jgi:hypothetical protein
MNFFTFESTDGGQRTQIVHRQIRKSREKSDEPNEEQNEEVKKIAKTKRLKFENHQRTTDRDVSFNADANQCEHIHSNTQS